MVTKPRQERWVRLSEFLIVKKHIPTVHRAAMKVGVPVVPGTPGPVAAYTEAEDFIKEYGFPGIFSI